MSSEKTTVERRSAPRKRVAYRMDVTDDERAMVGCLLDLSTGGMRVLCSGNMDILNVQSLRIEFPRWLDLGDGLPVKGRFVWCKSCSDGYGTEAGFAFDSMSKKDKALLEMLVNKLAEATQDHAG